MNEDRLKKLDAYQSVIDAEKRTSRRASEVFFDMPPLDVAIEGERLVRDDLNDTYHDFVTVAPEITPPTKEFEHIRESYWDKAKHVPPIAGAYENASLDDYFKVDRERSEAAIRQNVRQNYAADSPPVLLLDAIEYYAASLEIDTMTAARVATMHLGLQLPFMKMKAQQLCTELGIDSVQATSLVFAEFSTIAVPDHVQTIQDSSDRSLFRGMANKVLGPDEQPEVDLLDSAPALRLYSHDATGLTKVYKLERRPYDDAELQIASQLTDDPRIQAALIQFQMAIVEYSATYLQKHPERAGHSLLPFSEFFVMTDQGLTPNPKLLKVLCNNFLPALAGLMKRKQLSAVGELQGADFAEAALEARDRRVFFAQIGKFNNHDAATDTVELDAFISRTCPGMQTLTKGLAHQMPAIFDQLQ